MNGSEDNVGGWYLLFDDSCARCRRMAALVTAAGKGKIAPLDLCSETAMALLDRAYPGGWRWSPYVVQTSGSGVRAWGGRGAKVRVAVVLGPAGVLRYWNARRKLRMTAPSDQMNVVQAVLTQGPPRR